MGKRATVCIMVIALATAMSTAPAFGNDEQQAMLLKAAKAASDNGDFQSAVKTWQELAAQGNAKAQHNMGWATSTGSGIPKNDTEAVNWFRKSAASGYASAQYSLGLLYLKGRGVPFDGDQGRLWLNKAAAQGHSEATTVLRELDANIARIAEKTVVGTYHYANTMDEGLYFAVEPDEKYLHAFPQLQGHTSFMVANVGDMGRLMDMAAPESDPGTPYWCLSYAGEVGLQVGGFERRMEETMDGNEERIYAVVEDVHAKSVTSKECRGTPPG